MYKHIYEYSNNEKLTILSFVQVHRNFIMKLDIKVFLLLLYLQPQATAPLPTTTTHGLICHVFSAAFQDPFSSHNSYIPTN